MKRFSGCFAEACEDYSAHRVPMEIVCEASTMGDARIAFTVGWIFADVLNRREMSISDDELRTIAHNKFPLAEGAGKPFAFLDGFRRWSTTPATR